MSDCFFYLHLNFTRFYLKSQEQNLIYKNYVILKDEVRKCILNICSVKKTNVKKISLKTVLKKMVLKKLKTQYKQN